MEGTSTSTQPDETSNLEVDPISAERAVASNDTSDQDEWFEPSAEEITDTTAITIESRAFAGGGFAEIFGGNWRPPGRTKAIRVAVKVLRFNGLINPEEEDEQLRRINNRLEREMRVWGKLKHPHIVPLLGFMRANNDIIPDRNPCLVSPHYAFGDLGYYLKNHPEANSLNLLCQAAEGLEYLHSLQPPIAHLDIKAQNILIDNREQAQICDFGVSRVLEDIKTGLTTQDPIGYTINFACPEVLMGDPMTCAADVFSFAGLVLQTLSGNRPHYKLGAYVGRITLAISTGRIPVQSDHEIQMPPDALLELWKLLNQCWESDPSQRPIMTDVMKKLKFVQYLRSLHEDPSSSVTSNIATVISAEMHNLGQDSGGIIEIQANDQLTIQPLPFARGCSADIYEGSWLPPSKVARIKVAVKVLRVFGTYDTPRQEERLAHVTKRLRHEIRVCSRLKHARIVPLLGFMCCKDHTTLGDSLCLVSPLYRFKNLNNYLKSHPRADRLALLCQAAQGLSYLHTLTPPIVHLGIKAENVLVNDLEEAEICDFGVSCTLGVLTDGSSKPGDVGYTMNFVSPELLAGENATSAADVFSFAGLILQILSGKPPFYRLGASIGKISLAVSLGTVPARADHNIPLQCETLRILWELLDACWSKDPTKRPDMGKVILELARIRYLDSLKVEPTPADPPTQCEPTMVIDDPRPTIGAEVPPEQSLVDPEDRSHKNMTTLLSSNPFARGRNAIMFKGWWLPPGEATEIHLAVKVLQSSGMRNTNEARVQRHILEKRLETQMVLWRRLTHPNVGPLLGYMHDRSRESPCVISPYYRFGDIESYLRRHAEANPLALLCQAAEGLHYLHTQSPPIPHLNIKAENILINDQEEAVICDYGISSLMRDVTQGHANSRSGGSGDNALSLECPEHILNGKTDKEADVYSFASLSLQILSGKPPHYKASYAIAKVAQAISGGEVPKRVDHEIKMRPEALERLWTLLNQCWKMGSRQRPTMTFVAEELKSIRDLEAAVIDEDLSPDPARHTLVRKKNRSKRRAQNQPKTLIPVSKKRKMKRTMLVSEPIASSSENQSDLGIGSPVGNPGPSTVAGLSVGNWQAD